MARETENTLRFCGDGRELQLHENDGGDDADIFVYSKHPLAHQMIELAVGSDRNLRSAIEPFSPELECRNSQRCRILILDTYSSLEWVDVLTKWRSSGRAIMLVPPESASTNKQLQFLRLGAWGVVSITESVATELQEAIRCVAQGGYWVHRGALNAYVRYNEDPGRSQSQYLTIREHQIVSYMARGLSNKQIGNALGISERTVKFHVSNVLKKLNLKSRLRLLEGNTIPLWLTATETP